MLNKDIISNLTLKMKDEKSTYNKLGEKYDAETDIEKKNEIVDEMLIVKTNYEVIRADLKRYFDACLSYRKAMEASYPKDQLVELFVRIKRYENYLNDKYKMNLKHNDVDKNKAEANNSNKEPEKEQTEEKDENKDKPLEKGKKFNVKSVVKTANKVKSYTGKGILLAITALLGIISLTSAVKAISLLTSGTYWVKAILGGAVYGFPAYLTGKGAVLCGSLFNASRIDVDTLKKQIEQTKAPKAKGKKK